MDTQFASEFVSDALDKLGHDVPAEVLYPIIGDLHHTLDVREDLAFLDQLDKIRALDDELPF